MTPKGVKFVKSRSTNTPVANSQRQLQQMLERYGCTKFAIAQDYAERRSQITFTVPDDTKDGAPMIPVRLEVRTDLVAAALFGPAPRGYSDYGLAQAERVAWRNLLLWVDSALASAAVGLQPISETFLAHTLVPAGDGSGRVVRMVDRLEQTEGGFRRLLTSGSGA